MKEIGYQAGVIPTLHNMAHIFLVKKDARKAVKYWQQALDIAVEINDVNRIFQVMSSLGQLLVDVGMKKEGMEYPEKAVEIGERLGLPGTDKLKAFLRQLS